METDIVKLSSADLEEGEQLSDGSDEGYTPLRRPDMKSLHITDQSMAVSTSTSNMDAAADSISESEASSDESSSGSYEDVKKLTRCEPTHKEKTSRKKRPIAQLRVKPIPSLQNPRPKKYNIWCESLQEESLMENMRGFDVAKEVKNDRSVEAYDYSLKYRLNGENRLKRRLDSDSSDQFEEECCPSKKRYRCEGKNVKDRLGKRIRGENAPRNILDLEADEESSAEDVAREIANKLYEEKDDLLRRVVDVLGKKESIDIFKETQRIEREGGMMIMNGQRRRTPGGVFLFLIKSNDKLSHTERKTIFHEEMKKSVNERKIMQACRRDQKVEELKKRLNMKDKELKPLSSRAEIEIALPHLKPNSNGGTLSNPPPSPVTNSGQDNSPDYASHAINHVNDSSLDQTTRNRDDLDDESLTAYDDDVLDMNCDDMDMF